MYPSIGEQAHAKLKIAFYSKTSQTPIHLTHYILERLENFLSLRAVQERESSYQTSTSRIAEELSSQFFAKELRGTWKYGYWLGRQDSNLGMAVPKTAALPLGDAPIYEIDDLVLFA